MARFWRDTAGSHALEFGLCAFPFFGLVFCFSELVYINYFTDTLQLAVAQAARAVATGEAQSDSQTGTNPGVASSPLLFVQNFICSSSGVGTYNGVSSGSKIGVDNAFPAYLKGPNNTCGNILLDIQPATNFGAAAANAKATFYNQTTHYILGCPGTIVVIRVAYPLPAIFPISIFSSAAGTVTDFPNTNGKPVHVITAIQVVQTEPYENDGANGNVAYSDPPYC